MAPLSPTTASSSRLAPSWPSSTPQVQQLRSRARRARTATLPARQRAHPVRPARTSRERAQLNARPVQLGHHSALSALQILRSAQTARPAATAAPARRCACCAHQANTCPSRGQLHAFRAPPARRIISSAVFKPRIVRCAHRAHLPARQGSACALLVRLAATAMSLAQLYAAHAHWAPLAM